MRGKRSGVERRGAAWSGVERRGAAWSGVSKRKKERLRSEYGLERVGKRRGIQR
jgi:hypothetical protein